MSAGIGKAAAASQLTLGGLRASSAAGQGPRRCRLDHLNRVTRPANPGCPHLSSPAHVPGWHQVRVSGGEYGQNGRMAGSSGSVALPVIDVAPLVASVENWSQRDLGERIEQVRAAYLATLTAWPAEMPPSALT